jgi:hypothetical protein
MNQGVGPAPKERVIPSIKDRALNALGGANFLPKIYIGQEADRHDYVSRFSPGSPD